jgi:aldehyde:ferredoxin oxidoreductase
MAAVDSLGLCDFAQSGMASKDGMQNVYQMITAKSGQAFGEDDWNDLGFKVLKAEREFNHRAGFTNQDDRLPAMFYEEPLPPHNKVVVISDAEMDTTFDF